MAANVRISQAPSSAQSTVKRRPPTTWSRPFKANSCPASRPGVSVIGWPLTALGILIASQSNAVGSRSIPATTPSRCVVDEVRVSGGPRPAIPIGSSWALRVCGGERVTITSSFEPRSASNVASSRSPRPPEGSVATTNRRSSSNACVRVASVAAGPIDSCSILPARSAATIASRCGWPSTPA